MLCATMPEPAKEVPRETALRDSPVAQDPVTDPLGTPGLEGSFSCDCVEPENSWSLAHSVSQLVCSMMQKQVRLRWHLKKSLSQGTLSLKSRRKNWRRLVHYKGAITPFHVHCRVKMRKN